MPGFRAGEVNRVARDQLTPGGKGVNVAAVLAVLGVPADVGGFLGTDNASLFETFFAERGMGDRFVRLPGRTRTGVKVIDEQAEATTDINFPGLGVDGAALDALAERLAADAGGARWVALCGSLPPGAPPDLYGRLADVAKAAGASVALDTSGPALTAGVAAAPTLVKPNRAELEELVGRAIAGRRRAPRRRRRPARRRDRDGHRLARRRRRAVRHGGWRRARPATGRHRGQHRRRR